MGLSIPCLCTPCPVPSVGHGCLSTPCCVPPLGPFLPPLLPFYPQASSIPTLESLLAAASCSSVLKSQPSAASVLPLSPLWPSGAFGLLVKPWGAPGWPLNLLQPLCTSRLPITSQFWGTSRLPIPSWPHQTPRPVVPLCSLLGHEGSLASTSVMACPPTPIEFPPATVHLQISHHTPVVGLWLHFAPWLWGCGVPAGLPVTSRL